MGRQHVSIPVLSIITFQSTAERLGLRCLQHDRRSAWLVIGQQNSRAVEMSFPGVVVKASKVVKLTDQRSQLTAIGINSLLPAYAHPSMVHLSTKQSKTHIHPGKCPILLSAHAPPGQPGVFCQGPAQDISAESASLLENRVPMEPPLNRRWINPSASCVSGQPIVWPGEGGGSDTRR